MKQTFETVIGKVLLADIEYYKGHERSKRIQVFGEIVAAGDEKIAIRRGNGEVFCLPPDLSAVVVAQPGIYTLQSTGETVEDPDLLARWTVHEAL